MVPRRAVCLTLLSAVAIAGTTVKADIFNGVNFPSGEVSFVDEALHYDPLFSGGPAPLGHAQIPLANALGPPNFLLCCDHVPLGSGGLIELGFLDNLLTNDGTDSADLYVGEHWGTPEDFFVAIRPTGDSIALLDPTLDANGDGYFELGRYVARNLGGNGSVALVDIDAVFPGFDPGQLEFDAVQIMDDPNRGENLPDDTVGLDLEAVGAISATSLVEVPESVEEMEPNDSFPLRQILPPGIRAVRGEMRDAIAFDPGRFSFSFDESLELTGIPGAPGDVDFFDITGQTPGVPFIAWIDNTVGGVIPDTVLGTFADAGHAVLLNSDDDGSPVGDGTASGIAGQVNADGSIRLGVSGYDDFDFDGRSDDFGDEHGQRGDYRLLVQLGQGAFISGDVDYYRFTDLSPRSPFVAEVTASDFDSILALVDDAGNVLAIDDDGGVAPLSKLVGTVPTNGAVNLVVSGFPDFSFTGDHLEEASYDLTLEVDPSKRDLVPAATVWRFLDNGSNQGGAGTADPADTGWFASPGYNDGPNTAWVQEDDPDNLGGEYGYGDQDEMTLVNCGPSAPSCNTGNLATTYFRHTFDVEDASLVESLKGELLRDDAAAVYLNGIEVFRDANLPEGAAYNTFATSTGVENGVVTFDIDSSLLTDGDNVLAIEVHQVFTTSSDVSFSFYLYEIRDVSPPIPGDANGDDLVNRADVAILSNNFGLLSDAGSAQGDFDGDGAVTLRDLLILKSNLDSAQAAASHVAAVPEPTTLALATLALLALSNRRIGTRRRMFSCYGDL